MQTSRTIGLIIGGLALMEGAYLATTFIARHRAPPQQQPVAEVAMGVDTDESFLRTMIDRHKAVLAIVERELKLGDHPETREIAAAMREVRRKELTELERLEAKTRGKRI